MPNASKLRSCLIQSFASVLLAFAVFAPASAAWAQAQPTDDQLEIFRNLTPEQQQAVLESMSGSGGGGTRDGVVRDRDLEEPKDRTGDTTRGTTRTDTTRRDTRTTTTTRDLAGRLTGTKEEEEPRVAASDTVLLDITPQPPKDATADDRKKLQKIADRWLKDNPYQLDAEGFLRMSGVAPMALAGLTEEQATARVERDPALRNFKAELKLLPLEKRDTDALKPFGYDLFDSAPSTFAPVQDIPVPSEYVVGPGDRLEVQLIGNTKGRYSLVVNREGRVNFPELGPIAVAGMRFEAAKSRLESRVSEQMIGTTAVVSMGELRSIRVFVLGEAEQPGSYTVSGLSTITNALFASGGVKKIGSLRNIQLKRGGALVGRLDLYDLLLNGDTSDDVRLLPGDVIFIPPVGSTVSVTGRIRRPAIYELKGESTAADLMNLGGGVTPEADLKLATLERIDESRDRVVLDLDLTTSQARGARLRTGDLLRIPGTRPTYSNSVEVRGHVFRPTSFGYRQGQRLTDVLPSPDELRPNADLHYVLIRREDPNTKRVEGLSADLAAAWRAPTSAANIALAPRDRVYVFDLESGRAQYLDPIIDELKLQAQRTQPAQIVRVKGLVRAEGDYPLEPGMRVSDLIRAGGGLAEKAFGGAAELARYDVSGDQTRGAEVLKIDLAQAMLGDPGANLELGPYDTLVIKEISEWGQREFVRLEGEVRFPGEYPIERGETLQSVMRRAGGLTPLAFAQGSVFTRDSLKERERQQIRMLAQRMRQDLGTLALQASQTTSSGQAATQAAETLNLGRSLLADLQSAEPVGRLVIDLDRSMTAAPGSAEDVILKDGDRLRVPKRAQEVTVIGEVQNATSHLYDPSLSRDEYLRMSGGTTKKADEKRTYVVHANGGVEASSGSQWFRSSTGGIQPGDTIVVPLDAERMRPLPLWTAVSTILYNIAVAVAAVNSF